MIEVEGDFTARLAHPPDGHSFPTGPVAWGIVDEADQAGIAGGVRPDWADLSAAGPAVEPR